MPGQGSVGDTTMPFMTAGGMLDLLRRRRIGAVELLKLHLEQIEKANSAINAVVAPDAERALAVAAAADAMRVDEQACPPLLGLPMTVKDVFETEGLRTTCGMVALKDHVPTQDAEAVRRLKDAGAIVFGKTNVPEAASDHQTSNAVYGLTRNPHDRERTPGGSSGGAAAALAAGLTPLELGSDIGGSIRIPAHFCGVYGHKASFGVIPMRGHIPPGPGMLAPGDLGVAGPMARSAGDLELMFDILAAPDVWDRAALSLSLPPSRRERLADFRIAVWTNGPYAADTVTRTVLAGLTESLTRAGASVSEPPAPVDPAHSFDVYLRTLFAIVSGGAPLEALIGHAQANLPADVASYVQILTESARLQFAAWEGLREARHRIRRAWGEFFNNVDAVICPVAPTPAFRHDLAGEGFGYQLRRRRQVDGQDLPYLSQLMWPSLATVANLPATAVPVARSPEGLPVGVQIIGPYLEDRTTLRLAALIEQELSAVRPA
ncbi:amidase [Phenylobacterium montanum]|uniref:Amidase n=1 Tax=Phenylobacterium montanum TaxID=2823693 RepID=A0A975IVA6_9CAUL|nr:amidase [Caulobacter sp. S6]QUD88638.1 amidase [Caulobacter sp. S6]